MKKSLIFTALLFISIASFSQDLISMKNGRRLEVIVTEITPTLVRYKLFTEPKGKVYFAYKDNIEGIMYKDGRVETFKQPVERKIENNPNENKSSQYKDSNKSQKDFENIYSSGQDTDNKLKENKKEEILAPKTKSLTIVSDKYQEIVYLKNGSIIRGTIVEQIPNRSIKIITGDGNIFAFQVDDIEKIVKETPVNNRKSQSSFSGLQSGYKGIIDLGYYAGVGNIPIDRFNFNFINGYQINPYFSIGIGTGMHVFYNNYDYNSSVLIPVFADFRVSFTKARISPYLSFDIGYSFNASDDFNGIGYFVSPTIGISFKLSKQLEIYTGTSYELQNGVYHKYNGGNYLIYNSGNMGALSQTIGFAF